MNDYIEQCCENYSLIKAHADNEIRILKHMSGEDERDLDQLLIKRDLLKAELNEKHLYDAAQLKADLLTTRHNIRHYFIRAQVKNGEETTDNIESARKIDGLNDHYKSTEIAFNNMFRDLHPTNDLMNIKDIIIKYILDGSSNVVIKDVMAHYALYKKGELTNKACIKHGIRYTESNEEGPKGLFDHLLK